MQLRALLLCLAMLASGCALPAFGGPGIEDLPPLTEAEAASAFVDWHATRTDPELLAEHCADQGWGGCDGLGLPAGHQVAVRCSFTLPRFEEGPVGDARVLVVEHDAPDATSLLGHVVVERDDRWSVNASYERAPLLTSWDPSSANYGWTHTSSAGAGLDAEGRARQRRHQRVIAASCDEPELFQRLLIGGHVEHGYDPDVPTGVYHRVLDATDALRVWAEIGQPLDLDAMHLAPGALFGFRDDLAEAGPNAIADESTWSITIPADRPVRGGETADVLALLADEENERLDIEIVEDRRCVEPLGPVEGLTREDGVARVSIQPRHVTWCGQWFSIDLYVELEPPHEIVAIGVDVGDALRPTDGSEG